jgi:hypothetical protein
MKSVAGRISKLHGLMLRRLLNLLSLLSLLLCLATAGLWVRSYHRAAYHMTEHGVRGETRYRVEIASTSRGRRK